MKPPAKMKPIFCTISGVLDGKSTPLFDGYVEPSDSGWTTFFGKRISDKSALNISFDDWTPDWIKSAGQPKRAAAKNMTLILKNHLVMLEHGVVWSLAPGFWKNPVDVRTIMRAKAAAKPIIRFVVTCKINEKNAAFAFMHDGIPRDKPNVSSPYWEDDLSGPAWVMFDGDKSATFHADVSMKQEKMTLN